jgi:hypothetical protein
MRIDSSGNVGIGTSSPDANLHISGTGNEAKIILEGGGNPRGNFIAVEGADDLVFAADEDNLGASSAMKFRVDATERMRLDSSGNLLVGTTDNNPGNDGTGSGGIAVRSDGILSIGASDTRAAILNRIGSDGDIAVFRKNGDPRGSIGVDGANFYIDSADGNAGGIQLRSTDVLPRRNGALFDNGNDIGDLTYRWDDIYATNGTIQTSDRNEKQDIEALSDAEARVAQACKGLLRKFRWQDAVAEKGDDARIHFGIIAQDLQDAFTAEGLDAGRYAMFISSTWWETQTEVPAVEAVAEVLDDDGNVATEAVEAKEAYTRTDTYETQAEAPESATERTRLGVRYPELLAFIIAAI